MDRRTFLRVFGLGATGAAVAAISTDLVLDPERALWVPGRTTYFDLAPKFDPPEMLFTSEELFLMGALRILERDLTFAKMINRRYDDAFAVEGARVGAIVNVRMPRKYSVGA